MVKVRHIAIILLCKVVMHRWLIKINNRDRGGGGGELSRICGAGEGCL